MIKQNVPFAPLPFHLCGNAIDTPVEVEESQELTCVDIDTFLASF